MTPLRRLGVIAHPTRDVSGPRDALMAWAAEREIELDHDHGAGCDAIVAIGGDGTVLGGVRAAAERRVPVLGIACGSLGILTVVRACDTRAALERFAAGDWTPRELGALHVTGAGGAQAPALNDVTVVRRGAGQVKTDVLVDGERYVRLAGDGVVVSTPLGSSAYGMASGGPLLLPATDALVLTPLAAHGSNAPPLVVPGSTRLTLDVEVRHAGYRTEADGQAIDIEGPRFELEFRPGYARLVGFDDQEPFLAGLRRRLLIADSPRMLGHDERAAREALP
jgi:NAD+ kinase